MIAPDTYLRRLDEELVEALRYTGDYLDQLRAWVGAAYRVVKADADGATLTREHPPRRADVVAWDWVVSDGERAYAVKPFEFWSHCRCVPVE